MVNLELAGGVDFRKGCYPGQEIVARAQYRGAVKRRMYRLRGAALQPGQELYSDDTPGQASGTVVNAAGDEALAVLQTAAVDAKSRDPRRNRRPPRSKCCPCPTPGDEFLRLLPRRCGAPRLRFALPFRSFSRRSSVKPACAAGGCGGATIRRRYMEVYEGVADDTHFEALLAREAAGLGLERRVEIFTDAETPA